MSHLSSSSNSLDLDQQRKRAKDLIRAARAGDQSAIARIRAVRPDVGSASRPLALADAQLAVAREVGFASWPALVADLQARDLNAFKQAVAVSDEVRVRQLVSRPHVRAHINDPMFDFGQRPAHMVANHAPLLEVLVAAGADLNLASEWENGPFTVLDRADAEMPPFNIYCWTLGFGRSPMDVATTFGHHNVRELLVSRASPQLRFINAVLASDERAAELVIREHPSILSSLPREDHGRLAVAIFHENLGGVDLMLRHGFDPTAPGVDGGTALHAACWIGSVHLVERLIADGRVPLDARDPTHGGTPLGWAAFGSVHRRAPAGDYPAVAERLVAAGADIKALGNGGRTVVEAANGNPAMQEALRRLGASR